ncbi:hypothetical protein SETIT_7G292200v2 [Setaria italica]|uniref:Uncharacterized protein n=1 Tax=Setaria italica TaxID=4555 RepID=A0A368S183_SETIT|nr:hypothetical protein SETIT_7G292200v2 [Setaria italica]
MVRRGFCSFETVPVRLCFPTTLEGMFFSFEKRGEGIPYRGAFFRVVDELDSCGFAPAGDGDSRCAPEGRCLAASKSWRSRRLAWPGFCPGRQASSPSPADQEEVQRLGLPL